MVETDTGAAILAAMREWPDCIQVYLHGAASPRPDLQGGRV
jgi:hypothetical protein